MDAMAQLALMAKAKSIFETADSFLSFPALMSISYTPDQLRFATASTPEEMHAFCDFSTLTNALPQGAVFQPSLDNTLWDVYGGILNNGLIAEDSLTAQQMAELQTALSFLTDKAPDGTPVNSSPVIAYKQYQQAWFQATQSYNNEKITASTSSDPTAMTTWQNTEEPLARARVAAAESDWETKGYKVQVEQAQLTQAMYLNQSPTLQWARWKESLIPEIDIPEDAASNSQFAPTVFSPYDACDANWPTFSIKGSDIPNIISSAPAELKNIFNVASSPSVIDSITFEFCSVGLTRPWFYPEVFKSRFWKLSDPTVQLSDGNNPAAGEWPAYISAVVFARNIVINSHSAPVGQPQPVHTIPVIPVTPVHVVRPVISPILRSPAVLRSPTLVRQQAFSAAAAPAAVAVSAAPVTINPALRARLLASTFPRAAVQSPAVTSTPTPTPTPAPATPANNQISILAFICKWLPKCPNPDPSLKWA